MMDHTECIRSGRNNIILMLQDVVEDVVEGGCSANLSIRTSIFKKKHFSIA